MSKNLQMEGKMKFKIQWTHKVICFIFSLLFISFKANAFFIAANTLKINSIIPTHIFISGNSEKLGDQFLSSILTKTQVLKELYPADQIIILGRNDDQGTFTRSGFTLIESNSEMLKARSLEKVISIVRNCRSLDIYAHSNADEGIMLDKNAFTSQVLNEFDNVWNDFASTISKDSYIMIHGCNAGVKLAPLLASKFKIAVLAALTGTDFQNIYSDSYWTQDYNAKKVDLSNRNMISFEEVQSCKSGFCKRMKPDNSTYKGYWGDWTEGGYPTYKIFCGSNNNLNCGHGAIEAILTYPSIMPARHIKSIDQFKDLLTDFLCPYQYNSSKQSNCKSSLEKSLIDDSYSSYSPFRGTTLNCDFIRCQAHFRCGILASTINPSSCKLINENSGLNNTFTNEYKFLIKNFISR